MSELKRRRRPWVRVLFAASMLACLDGFTPHAVAANTSGVITTDAGGPGVGIPFTVAQTPVAITVGPSGTLYIADDDKQVVRTLAGTPPVEKIAAGIGVVGSSGDGGPAVGAELGYPDGVALASNGSIVVADTGFHRVRSCLLRPAPSSARR